MGRHSAPDDEDDASAVALRERDDAGTAGGAAAEAGSGSGSGSGSGAGSDVESDAESRGRHSRTPLPVPPAPSAPKAPKADEPVPDAPVPDGHDVPLDELIGTGEPEAQTETIPAVRPGPPDAAPTDTTAPFQPVGDGGSSAAAGDGAPRRSPASVASHAAHNSAADLHLVRSHRGVLALCALAILLPFVAEVVVLLVLGTLDAHSFAVWIWAPIVGAGVLLGVVLDLAHRHYSRRPEPSPGQAVPG